MIEIFLWLVAYIAVYALNVWFVKKYSSFNEIKEINFGLEIFFGLSFLLGTSAFMVVFIFELLSRSNIFINFIINCLKKLHGVKT